MSRNLGKMNNFHNICRICLVNIEEDNSLPIEDVSNIIMLCSSIKIEADDGLPPFICKSCNQKAKDAYNFKILCEESDMHLRSDKMLKLDSFNNIGREEVYDETTDIESEIMECKVTNEDERIASMKPKTIFKCSVCDMVFLYKKRLLKHETKHKDGFTCEECGKCYASAKLLALHLSIKKRKGSHLCQICGKEYTMPENLKRHQRIHKGIRPFSCELCDKSFTQSNELKSHMITHTNEKTFLCNYCGHKFSRKRSLQVHITRLHVNKGEKYPCTLCGRSFKGLADVKTHQLIHAGNKKYVCKVCSKGFIKSNNLKVHERIHNGQRPFVCHICQKAFIQKHVLDKHLNTHPVL